MSTTTQLTVPPRSDDRDIDVIVSGSCVLDIIVRPIDLDRPIGEGIVVPVEPFGLSGGGITSNAGIALARLGARVAVLTYAGRDEFGDLVEQIMRREHIDTTGLIRHAAHGTSSTVAVVNRVGERSFLHASGATNFLDAQFYADHHPLLRRSRILLLGYYSFLRSLEPDLDDVFRRIRSECGCLTAFDSAGSGGTMDPLRRILPYIDIYIPSLSEARAQTGVDDPQAMIAVYRQHGAPGIVGVKLGGANGVLLSPADGEFVHVPSATPPDPVVDTTGAGDCFFAGFLAGLCAGLSVERAGRVGTAAAACCVTRMGGYAGVRDWSTTLELAGLSEPAATS